MELHQLRYFVAVAEALSFSRAAEHCGVAQPSLSQQIRKLEEQLDLRLFDRLSRGVAITDAGSALLPRARTILAEVNALQSGVRSSLEAGDGPLVVGAIPTMAPYLLPPLLKRFVKKFPRCELTIRENLTDQLVEALVDHELDIAIMSTPIENSVLQLRVVGRERLLVTSARGYTLPRQPGGLTIRDLQDQPAVVLHEMHCLGQQIESFCSARKLKRRIVCRSTQLATVLQLVGLGLGISVIPEMCARQDHVRSCTYWALGKRGPTREIAVAYRVDRTLSRLSREFIAMLKEDMNSGKHSLEAVD